jgi:hypothetical protein
MLLGRYHQYLVITMSEYGGPSKVLLGLSLKHTSLLGRRFADIIVECN